MTDKKNEDEVRRALIADATDPNAWERVAVVPPSSSPRPTWYGNRQAPTQAPVEDAAREEEALRRKQLHDAIAALPEDQRHVIQLWMDGFHYAVIAKVLGVRVDAVKSRLRDAKRHLGQNLDAATGRQIDQDHRAGAKAR